MKRKYGSAESLIKSCKSICVHKKFGREDVWQMPDSWISEFIYKNRRPALLRVGGRVQDTLKLKLVAARNTVLGWYLYWYRVEHHRLLLEDHSVADGSAVIRTT